MDAHHDVPIALLQGNQKRAGLVHMNHVQQFVHHNEDVVVLFDGWRRWVLCAWFYLNCYWCSNLRRPDTFCYPFMCPFCILSKLGKCLRIRVVVRLCHVV